MAAAAAVIDLEDDDDELWNFNSGEDSPGPSPTPVANATVQLSSDDEDDLKFVPADKRRKLLKLPRLRSPRKKQAAAADGKGSGSSSDVEVVSVRQALAAQQRQPDEFELALQHQPAKPLQRQVSAREQAAQAALQRNQQALAQLRAQLAAPPPELPEQEEEEEVELALALAAEARPPEPSASEPAEEPACEGERIVVKLRTPKQADPLKLRIGSSAPFERMFAVFRAQAVARGWVAADTPLRFLYDGDELSGTDTAVSADVEDECVIDVSW